jgi:branched-chain amino acid aminotransferase
MTATSYCWINGTILPTAQATVPVTDHGLLYGDGIFEGMRFFSGKLFNADQHFRRLQQSARALGLVMPYPQCQLEQAIDELIACYQQASGYIRLVITRGQGPLGLDPSQCDTASCFIIIDQLQLASAAKQAAGLTMITAATRRATGTGLDSRVKSLNYLHSILAKMEARTAGADDAVMLNNHGFVAEATAANIFIEKDGALFTPPATDGCLEGITRAEIITSAMESGISVQIQSLTNYDLYTADACFLSGSGAGLLAVKELDGRPLKHCPGEVFQQLKAEFMSKTKGATDQS